MTNLKIIVIFTTNSKVMSIVRFNAKLVDTVELVKLSRKGIAISLFEEIVNLISVRTGVFVSC